MSLAHFGGILGQDERNKSLRPTPDLIGVIRVVACSGGFSSGAFGWADLRDIELLFGSYLGASIARMGRGRLSGMGPR